MLRHWHRLPAENVDAPSLGVLEAKAGWDPEQLGLVEAAPAHGRGGWNLIVFKVPSNPEYSMIQAKSWRWQRPLALLN